MFSFWFGWFFEVPRFGHQSHWITMGPTCVHLAFSLCLSSRQSRPLFLPRCCLLSFFMTTTATSCAYWCALHSTVFTRQANEGTHLLHHIFPSTGTWLINQYIHTHGKPWRITFTTSNIFIDVHIHYLCALFNRNRNINRMFEQLKYISWECAVSSRTTPYEIEASCGRRGEGGDECSARCNHLSDAVR